ncbi:GAF domain-containing hybrid sensor histidine kinase/response regulator [Aliikangiella sp. G2MR2-5]|uniref:GAF domain-containing hybrid sensor histidine kinase/response regulator n=1 Tax=Aliikangiella sp. G2MR2-5 TaxID=2788943 RepID=UPI0018AB22C1|nr:ATP-binding protein [Aliikangiella sp. G2MR2-5]
MKTKHSNNSLNTNASLSNKALVATIAAYSEKVNQPSAKRSIAECLAQHLGQLVTFNAFLFGLFNEKTQAIEFDYVLLDNREQTHFSTHMSEKANPAIKCILEKVPIHHPRVSSKDPFRLNTRINSYLFWPLLADDQVIGVISVQSNQQQAFDSLTEEVMCSFANITASAVKLSKIQQEIETQKSSAILSNQNVRIISEIGREINSTLDLETVLWTVYQHVNKLMDATVFGIGIYDEKEQLIRIDLAMERGQRYKPYTRTMEIKNQFPVWCIENRKVVFINDIRIEGKKYFDVNEYDNWENKRPVLKDDAYSGVPLALIYVPMMLNDMVYGFITVQTFETGSYTDIHVDILRSIAGYTVNAIANANAHQQLEKTKESLRLAKREAEKTAESKMRFLANMSHEIRTPMNIILGFMNVVLEHDQLSQEDKEHINTAHSAAQHLLTIIDDILDVTKNESGKLVLESIPFDLFKLLSDTSHLLKFKAEEKGLAFHFDYSPQLSHYFRGDPVRINQVILNLSGNAIKFTENGSIKLKVEQVKGSKEVLFSISDTGIGISQEKQENIFESFTQADTSTTRTFGGTGLGTTISRQLVNAMKGKIWLESHLGKGTTFYFTLPLEVSEKSQIPVEDHNEDSSDSPFKSLNVLIVEDTAPNALLMSVVMRKKGHQLTIVDDGQKALQAIKENNFDIVFMDVQMPIMDGLTATRKIRQLKDKNKSNVTIVAMTASALQEDRQACFDAGMDEVQTKPVDFKELFAILNRAMQASR